MLIVNSRVLKIVQRVVPLVLLATSAGDMAHAQTDVERGRLLVTKLCGECHAVGMTGTSPHAAAPPFRSIDDRANLDEFVDRLRDGLQSTHSDMPSFRFSREDARAAVAYLRSIQRP